MKNRCCAIHRTTKLSTAVFQSLYCHTSTGLHCKPTAARDIAQSPAATLTMFSDVSREVLAMFATASVDTNNRSLHPVVKHIPRLAVGTDVDDFYKIGFAHSLDASSLECSDAFRLLSSSGLKRERDAALEPISSNDLYWAVTVSSEGHAVSAGEIVRIQVRSAPRFLGPVVLTGCSCRPTSLTWRSFHTRGCGTLRKVWTTVNKDYSRRLPTAMLELFF